MKKPPSRPGPLRRLLAGLLILPAVGAAADLDAVPSSWIAYSELVGRQLQVWFGADNDPARRLRAYLEQQGRPGPLLVRLWFDRDGHITRLEADGLGDTRADRDLRRLWTRQPVSEPPPPGMAQPLMLRVRFPEPAENAENEAGDDAGTAGRFF